MTSVVLADISSGNTGAADVFFLIGVILGILSAILYASRRADAAPFAPVLLALAVASVSLAWLVL